jgi:PHP family Zn ribbon phosphoesterase
MQFAADLHLHSRFSSGVSPEMTLENLAWWAQRKGVDLLGTGDCLQPQWLEEIEAKTEEAEPGLRRLRPVIEREIHAKLPEGLRRSLRFVLSTEVNCAPKGTDPMRGLHQLLYFPSLEVARAFAARVGRLGDLRDGRPTLDITARLLLRGTANFERVHLAPAHVMNPWFSIFGVIGGQKSLEHIYEDGVSRLLAVETGLTSDPGMCRRVPALDRFGLFSCSDAHSLENLGRECTLLEVEPAYDAIMAALRAGTRDAIRGTIKVPLRTTRYYLNWCSACKRPFDAKVCPECNGPLVTGSRDRLPQLEGARPEAHLLPGQPPFEPLLQLAEVVAALTGRPPKSEAARRDAGEMVDRSGRHERFLLTEAPLEELLALTSPEIAGAILSQRRGGSGRRSLGQMGLGL